MKPTRSKNPVVFPCPNFDELNVEQMQYVNHIAQENLRIATDRSDIQNQLCVALLRNTTLNSDVQSMKGTLEDMKAKFLALESSVRRDLEAVACAIEELRNGYITMYTLFAQGPKPPTQ